MQSRILNFGGLLGGVIYVLLYHFSLVLHLTGGEQGTEGEVFSSQ